MESGNPCNVCGNTNLNLVDGYYYCVECGTQDATARETIIEVNALSDGTFAQTFRKKIQVLEDKIEMTGEWYKWHAYNFVIAALADEMIKLGAKPSFKMKLLWVWTRYIKKFQNKSELGLTKEVNETTEIIQDEEDKAETTQTRKYLNVKDCPYRRISYITPMLIYTMIYVALNLDKSEIQLSHLTTFFKEKRVNVYDVFKYIPKEIDCRKIPDWQIYLQCYFIHVVFSTYRIRTFALTLFKELDLGYPVIPDLRKLVENYSAELCLPEDFKQLVFSLLYEYPCEFINVDQKANLSKVPDYEGVCMSYILVALKMCFGLDDEYELKLSDVVDKINHHENHLKCYKSSFMETDRLFSFREWLKYLQFRKKILVQNCLHTETEHYNDIDDYTYMEYVGKDTSRYQKITLEDEITLNILNKIPQEEMDILPKSLFESSLTPMATYSKIIGENHNDADVRLLICEDFSKYSLKYICEDLNLVAKGKNILLGVEKSNKSQTGGEIKTNFAYKMDYSMVFIKNCENKNWMQTNPPSLDHITVAHKDKKDSESDHGYDSQAENMGDKDMSEASNLTKDSIAKYDLKVKTIMEEDENLNIYDDDFVEIYYKEEVESAVNDDLEEEAEEPQLADNNDDLVFSDEEGLYYHDSIEFNPDTFNRDRAIKDLILAACKQYKIPIPQEYRQEIVLKRKLINDEAGASDERKRIKKSAPGEAKQEVQNLINLYYESIQRDVMNNISDQVQEAIRNANSTIVDIKEQVPGFSSPKADDALNNGLPPNETQVHEDENALNESQSNAQIESIADNTEIEITENIENTLFDENSDGEANLEEIIPRSDPKFDEKKFDTNQLYIKVLDDNKDHNFPDIGNEPDIKEMLEQKIKEPPECKPLNIDDVFDSEDDLPLTMLKEDKCFQKELEEKMKENRDRLIKNDNIPKYRYWLRHYKSLNQVADAQKLFDTEARKYLPRNFRFILSECAGILSCSSFHMYKSMQYLEKRIMSKPSQTY